MSSMQAEHFDVYSPPLPKPVEADEELLARLGLDGPAFRGWLSQCPWLQNLSWDGVISEFFHAMFELHVDEVLDADLATAFHKIGMAKETADDLGSHIVRRCGPVAECVFPPETGANFMDMQLQRVCREIRVGTIKVTIELRLRL